MTTEVDMSQQRRSRSNSKHALIDRECFASLALDRELNGSFDAPSHDIPSKVVVLDEAKQCFSYVLVVVGFYV